MPKKKKVRAPKFDAGHAAFEQKVLHELAKEQQLVVISFDPADGTLGLDARDCAGHPNVLGILEAALLTVKNKFLNGETTFKSTEDMLKELRK